MKVLLINLKSEVWKDLPLGLLYIAKILLNNGHMVELVDISPNCEDQVIPKIHDAEAVGISCSTPNYNRVVKIAQLIRAHKRDIPLIAGGSHATIMPESLLNHVDFCVIGEGEQTIPELIDALYLTDKEFVKNMKIPGLAFKETNGKITITSKRNPLPNLDELPFPARELADPHYFLKGRTTMISSRGCPLNCFFCQPTLRAIFGNKVRRRSVDDVMEEIDQCIREFDVSFIKFVDDTFTFNKEWVLQFCDEMAYRKIAWHCLTRVDVVDSEILKAMKMAGCEMIDFGVESGSQRILDFYNKGTSLEQIIEAFRLCHKWHIKTTAFIMIGAPFETKQTIYATEQLIKKIKPFSLYVDITTAIPHTYLWNYCLKNGLIDGEEWKDYFQPNIKSTFSMDELKAIRKRMMRSFFFSRMLHPSYFYYGLKHHAFRDLFNVTRNMLGGTSKN